MVRPNTAWPANPSIEHLSRSISIHRSNVPLDNIDATISNLAPNLILLFSWTGALPQHISKYISGHQVLFPQTPILCIRTSINDFTYRSKRCRRHSLAPALAFAQSFDRNILLHAFSEGGASTAVHFAKAFRALTQRKLPLSALVLDSCPGTLQFTRLAATARKTVPHNPAAQVLTSLAAYGIIASYWTTAILVGVRDDVSNSRDLNSKTRRELDNPYFWSTGASRGYLFSKADSLIDWNSVLAHAKAAEKRGTPVQVTMFEGSAHCAHIRETADAERYWSAVEGVWEAREVKNVGGEKPKLGEGVEWSVVEMRTERRVCTCSDCGPY